MWGSKTMIVVHNRNCNNWPVNIQNSLIECTGKAGLSKTFTWCFKDWPRSFLWKSFLIVTFLHLLVVLRVYSPQEVDIALKPMVYLKKDPVQVYVTFHLLRLKGLKCIVLSIGIHWNSILNALELFMSL